MTLPRPTAARHGSLPAAQAQVPADGKFESQFVTGLIDYFADNQDLPEFLTRDDAAPVVRENPETARRSPAWPAAAADCVSDRS